MISSAKPPEFEYIDVLLVDDHPAILDALARAMQTEDEIKVVGNAKDGQTAAAAIESLHPQVVVCDVQMGGEAEGLRLLDAYGAGSGPAFLMLSAYDYPSLFRAAYDRGAAGFVLKTSELADVVAAVKIVANGGTAFTAAARQSMQGAPRRPSERELEVLDLVAGGASNEEIGSRLTLSIKTIESHLRRMCDRYGAMNRTELAVFALREGWVADVDSGQQR